jgi:mevalonate kinase
VYGHPAIAVPVKQVRAKAIVSPAIGKPSGYVQISAPDISLESALAGLLPDNPLARAISEVLTYLEIDKPPAFNLQVTSTIPIASGLGSGAAVSVAIIRAVAGFMGAVLSAEIVSELAFRVEEIHHGTPSGIDNTVVAYELPVYYVKDQPVEIFTVNKQFTIVIGDTGVASPTSVTVGEVREAWRTARDRYEVLFSCIGAVAVKARDALEMGDLENLGLLMNENHVHLQKMGVSSYELDRLVVAARSVGALGSKMSGGGRGGNMIALVDSDTSENVAQALLAAGAKNAIVTQVGAR